MFHRYYVIQNLIRFYFIASLSLSLSLSLFLPQPLSTLTIISKRTSEGNGRLLSTIFLDYFLTSPKISKIYLVTRLTKINSNVLFILTNRIKTNNLTINQSTDQSINNPAAAILISLFLPHLLESFSF